MFIGNTGLTLKAETQSATIDQASGKMYFAASLSNNTSGLYEVSLTNGTASLINAFKHNEEVVGLYTLSGAADDAPAAVADLKVNFANGSTHGNVSFTAPSATNADATLSGSLNYRVRVDGEVKASGTATAGQSVVSSSFSVQQGYRTFSVTTSNTAGVSPAAAQELWIGADEPKPVTDVTLTLDENDSTIHHLSWTAPNEGVHLGYINPAKLTYTVVRYPEEETVATDITVTSFTETLSMPGSMQSHWYTVTVKNDTIAGQPAGSNHIAIGPAFATPWYDNFENQNDFDIWTVVNNGSTYTWEWYGGCAHYPWARSADNGDDWLISPPLYMTADRTYYVGFAFSGSGYPYEDEVEAYFAESREPADLKAGIEIQPAFLMRNNDIQHARKRLQVPHDGIYHLGIHAISPGGIMQNGFFVDSVYVENGEMLTTPDSVKNLVVTPAAKGLLKATLHFDAPATNIGGYSISALDSINIYNGDSLITSLKTVEPGKHYSYVDNTPTNGYNTYKVVPYNSYGKGTTREAIRYVGIDLPLAPKNVRLTDTDDHIVLTWEAPDTVGVNGGYVNTSDLRYLINNSFSQNAWIVKDKTFNDYGVDLNGEMSSIYYLVVSVNEFAFDMEKSVGYSNALIIGKPYELPFKEKFDMDKDGYYWARYPYGAGLYITRDKEKGGSEGILQMSPYKENDRCILQSGKIKISDAVNPVLRYRYYAVPGAGAQIRMRLQYNSDYTTTLDSLMYEDMTGDEGWVTREISLNNYKGARYIVLDIDAKSLDGVTDISLDDVYVIDKIDYDLAASMSLPKKGYVSRESKIKVLVENQGQKTANAYSVSLYCNGELLSSQEGSALDPDSIATHTFSYTPSANDTVPVMFSAKVEYAEDMKLSNNTTDTASLYIVQNEYPTVSNLHNEGTESSIRLVWDEPDLDDESLGIVTEDFESYKPFIIDNIGDWTLYDVKGSITAGFQKSGGEFYSYDNIGAPFAFQVMNPEEAGITSSLVSAHSGKQMLMGMVEQMAPNDDWLVSPLLSGEAQTIDFWVKGLTDQYTETYQVLYSTTTMDRDSFRLVSDGNVATPTDWTNVQYNLPEGTKYFAIRLTSNDQFAFFLDDITYRLFNKEGLEVAGYNIYVDGKKVNSDLVSYISYDMAAESDDKEHAYQVSAVYAGGMESRLCAPLIIGGTASGISTIISASEAPVDVYTVDGKIVRKELLNGSPLKQGVYIFKQGESVRKVVVK